jgi:hypothetical protein
MAQKATSPLLMMTPEEQQKIASLAFTYYFYAIETIGVVTAFGAYHLILLVQYTLDYKMAFNWHSLGIFIPGLLIALRIQVYEMLTMIFEICPPNLKARQIQILDTPPYHTAHLPDCNIHCFFLGSLLHRVIQCDSYQIYLYSNITGKTRWTRDSSPGFKQKCLTTAVYATMASNS